MDLLKEAWPLREVFPTETIYRMEVAEAAMIDFLMDKFMKAIVYYDDETRVWTLSGSAWYLSYPVIIKGISLPCRRKVRVEKLYLRLLLVTDYICGMTDSYAKRLHQELKAII